MSDPRHMKRALTLARRAEGKVEPNPMVGCVLVRDDKVIGEGYHRAFGGPHAEIEALRACAKANHDPRGCEVYVTLEPCCHHGKTPPCTDALIAAGVARVYIGAADPFPQVAGKGIAALRDAGVMVEVGIEHDVASDLIAPFAKRIATGLPWVIAKWAQTLDGRIATATGESKWISNEASRKQVHQLRARVDAVMVGIGTVVADDPLLTARDVRLLRTARRVVIDPTLRIALDAKLLHSLDPARGGGPVMIATSHDALETRAATASRLMAMGVEILPVRGRENTSLLDLQPVLAHLARAHGATNVLVEGGSKLLSALLAQGLIDQAIVYIGPRIVGDENAPAAFAGFSPRTIADGRGVQLRHVTRVGDDVMLDYRMGG